MKLWQSLLSGELDQVAELYNSSIDIDSQMLQEDIRASIAHVEMLQSTAILPATEADTIVAGLKQLSLEAERGELAIDYSAEDVHTFVENTLMQRIGPIAGKMHTARSRNDQVVTDFRLKIISDSQKLLEQLSLLLKGIAELATEHRETILPGLTHLQPAQPITLAHHLLAWGFAIKRDRKRLLDALDRVKECPLGACALAGTTFPIDRQQTSDSLGFIKPLENSMDAVSARDFVLEVLSVLAILHSNYSRIAEELVLWSTAQFSYIRMSDEFATGSSIMPQKVNPDIAELIRGKTGRIYGSLLQGFTMVKGLPLSYSKDLQEDKEAVFDALATCINSTILLSKMLSTMQVNKDRMLEATERGYLQATDIADYLAKKGVPFREAHHIAAKIVKYAMAENKTLTELRLSEYREFSELFAQDIFKAIDLYNMIEQRISLGSPSSANVELQIKQLLS